MTCLTICRNCSAAGIRRLSPESRATTGKPCLICILTMCADTGWTGHSPWAVARATRPTERPPTFLTPMPPVRSRRTEIFGASEFIIPGVRLEQQNVSLRHHPQPLINRMASSAAHVSGKPLTSSETCTWLRNHFRTTLSQAKPEIDQLFLCGINHIFFHGTVYSPRQAVWPGWLFYASMEYNSRNAIWRDAPLLNEYVTRCQSILQAGEPDNDIALYWPVYDNWHSPDGMEQNFSLNGRPQWINGSACGHTGNVADR